MPDARQALSAALASLLLATSVACSSDEITDPPETPEGTITADAATGWAYASLPEESVVTIADPATSAEWDMGFNATRVMLNGGEAGPGSVVGHCICQNTGASDAEIVAMTADGELADFEAVTSSDIPAATSFEEERLQTAIAGWYGGEGAGATAESGITWLVRLQDGTSFAKLRVLSLIGPTADHAGQVAAQSGGHRARAHRLSQRPAGPGAGRRTPTGAGRGGRARA